MALTVIKSRKKDMSENAASILAAIATFFAAIAAWCSFEVARRSLDFQKKFAKNQKLINKVNRTIYKTETLQIFISEPFEMTDEEFDSIEYLLKELKSELERFNNRNLINYQELKISKIETMYELVKEFDSLKEVIDKLETINAEIFE